jgi:hypothetical protein
MKSINLEPSLVHEEKRSSLLYLIIIFGWFIAYETLAITVTYLGYVQAEFYVFPYLFILSILLLCIYIFARAKYYYVKYIILFGFNIYYFLIQFFSSKDPVVGGDVVEILMVLFSPIFLNFRFFWIVILVVFIKYIINFLLTYNYNFFILPMFYVFFEIIVFIILLRIKSYIRVLQKSHVKSNVLVIKNFMKVLGLKNETIVDHSERVASLCLIFVKKFNLVNEKDLNSFYFSCLLHDIGKIKYTDEMLAGKLELTIEEKELVENHPIIASEILCDLEDVDIDLDVIKYHHEAWDGSGYPYGLKSTEIPILAQVLSLANTFDSLTESSPYRSAISYNEAYQVILNSDKFSEKLRDQFKQVYPLWINEMIKIKSKVG